MYLPTVQVEKAVHQLQGSILIRQIESTAYPRVLCVAVRGKRSQSWSWDPNAVAETYSNLVHLYKYNC